MNRAQTRTAVVVVALLAAPVASAQGESAAPAKAGAEVEPASLGAEVEPASETKAPRQRVAAAGYFQPRIGFTYRPEAVPRDQLTYGAADSRTGVMIFGEPVPRWRYMLHTVVGANLFENLTSAQTVDENGDGTPDDIVTTSQIVPGLLIEEASVGFHPSDNLAIKIGQMRIPYTMQHQSPNTALLFPVRSGPNRVFLTGSEAGVMFTASAHGGKLRTSLGAFGGSKMSPQSEIGAREQGPLFSLRIDFAPLGAFPFGATDLYRGPLRFEVGAGALYGPAALFDDAGFSQANVQDIRISGSARLRAHGFHLQGELLARRRSDSVSNRNDATVGAYAQAHMLVSQEPVAIAPIGRFGWTVEDRDVDPRTTLFAEAGIAVYLRPKDPEPDNLTLLIQYVGEFRRTEGENAHGGLTQVQKRF